MADILLKQITILYKMCVGYSLESRSEIPWKFWNVVLEKDGEDQVDRSSQKWSTAKSKGGKEHPISIKQRKANWSGHMLHRNCLLKHVTEGRI